MKNLIILINVVIIVAIAAIFTDPESLKHVAGDEMPRKLSDTPAKSTHPMASDFVAVSKEQQIKSSMDEFVTEFIQEMAEARLMDLEEGKMAQQKSTTRDLKLYGTLMVNDQTEMLTEIEKLAALKMVPLARALGPDKTDGLNDLKEVHGKSFDKKFIKMMIIDHKRDVKKFEKAIRSSDADVQVFATRYLPYVQSHLEKIRSLK
jgi:putative membrane protein